MRLDEVELLLRGWDKITVYIAVWNEENNKSDECHVLHMYLCMYFFLSIDTYIYEILAWNLYKYIASSLFPSPGVSLPSLDGCAQFH